MMVAVIQCRAASDPSEGAAINSTPPPIHATVPACHTKRIRVRKLSGWMVARAKTLVSPSTPWMIATKIPATPAHCRMISRIETTSIQLCMVRCRRGGNMGDQLSAQDWVDQGLKTLAKSGFTALKAEPLAKAMGVSRGSFYWHFADIAAFHAAILKHWREVAAEQVIAGLEASAKDANPLALLLRRAFASKQALEKAVRSWAAIDPKARAAVQAIDRRRVDYVE